MPGLCRAGDAPDADHEAVRGAAGAAAVEADGGAAAAGGGRSRGPRDFSQVL